MRINTFDFSAIKKIIFIICLYLIIPAQSHATFIDFNELELTYDEQFPCWCDNPLTDQYLDKGLSIQGSWVNGENSENAMTTSNWAALDFIGELPTFVSMNINTIYGDAVYLDVYGVDGYLLTKITGGWRGPYEGATPIIDGEYIAINAAEGIRQITVQGFYGMRMGASIDNLTFTYTSIPEPSAAILIALGLIGIGFCRRRNSTE